MARRRARKARRREKSYLASFLAISFLLGSVLGGALVIGLVRGPEPLELPENVIVTRSINIVGVLEDTNVGKLATLTVELRQGKGHVFINAASPYEGYVMQEWTTKARDAVEFYMGGAPALSSVDIAFTVEPFEEQDEKVDGPSASAAMAVVLAAAIENWEVRQDTVISAKICEHGNLYAIGKPEEKLLAVETDGRFTRFIVSDDQWGTPPHSNITIIEVNRLQDLLDQMKE